MSKKAESTPDTSWKMIAGFAGFLIVGVVAMELLTRKEPTAQVEAHDHDLDHPTDAANMQALPQIEELEKRIAADPKDVKLVLQLANLLQDAKFYDKAIQNYKTYLAQMPNDPDALVDLGICYYDIGQYAEATSYMMKALQVDPKHVLGHFNLGIVALRQGKMKEANEWFRKTIELAPESPAGRQAKQFIEQHPAS
jgi:tetratricopeptide (TPR) repeat protein